MLKENKGITLVALIITIIVMLILAGVSISLVVGDNGVLTQAGNAKKSTVRGAVVDAISLGNANFYAAQYETGAAKKDNTISDLLASIKACYEDGTTTFELKDSSDNAITSVYQAADPDATPPTSEVTKVTGYISSTTITDMDPIEVELTQSTATSTISIKVK